MKIACLIITYTSALQTQRLIQKLDNGNFDFYIHVDKKMDIKTHSMLFDMPNVFFVKKRIDVKWASYTSIKATFSTLEEIEMSGINYDFLISMSGQDHAIKSADYITDFLQKNIGKQFIHYVSFDEWTGVQRRIDKHHLEDLNIFGKFYIQKLLNLLVPKRRSPNNIKIYGYSSFWTLSMDCALYVKKYIKENPSLGRYFKYTFGSDEFVFQTVIMNSHYKDSVVNNHYRYIDWSDGGMRPKFLKKEDFEKLKKSDCLFARKFNMATDGHILDLIDEHNSNTPFQFTESNNCTPFISLNMAIKTVLEYSIVMCSYNPDERIMRRCLKAIQNINFQDIGYEIIL